MTNFLDDRITVKQYCTQFFEMNVKRQMFSDEEDVLIQKAYGDYDEVVSLPYTIDEPTLRERVAKSLKTLKTLAEHSGAG